jgi:hypothetical protein
MIFTLNNFVLTHLPLILLVVSVMQKPNQHKTTKP